MQQRAEQEKQGAIKKIEEEHSQGKSLSVHASK